MSEIKDCPFCGDDGQLVEARNLYHVQCESHGYDCFAQTFPYLDSETAIEKWNKRVKNE